MYHFPPIDYAIMVHECPSCGIVFDNGNETGECSNCGHQPEPKGSDDISPDSLVSDMIHRVRVDYHTDNNDVDILNKYLTADEENGDLIKVVILEEISLGELSNESVDAECYFQLGGDKFSNTINFDTGKDLSRFMLAFARRQKVMQGPTVNLVQPGISDTVIEIPDIVLGKKQFLRIIVLFFSIPLLLLFSLFI